MCSMVRWLTVVLLSSMAYGSLLFADTGAEKGAAAQPPSAGNASAAMPGLPAPPPGSSTVVGGIIRAVDPVRDELTLQVYGARPERILFDERTQVFRDGVKTPVLDLRAQDHASVETVLDGTNVFALSIHMLSHSPEGECQGQVTDYEPGTGLLTINDAVSQQPIKLRVPASASIVAEGQAASAAPSGSAQLARGALVSVRFQSDNTGQGVATHIAILATPGSSFVFSGNIAYLDLHAHLLVITDPRDGKSYRIFFDPARFTVSDQLHEGRHVSVTTSFDGSRYVASQIDVN